MRSVLNFLGGRQADPRSAGDDHFSTTNRNPDNDARSVWPPTPYPDPNRHYDFSDGIFGTAEIEDEHPPSLDSDNKGKEELRLDSNIGERPKANSVMGNDSEELKNKLKEKLAALEGALEFDDDIVSCPICMDHYDDNVLPISLPCGHCVCKTCYFTIPLQDGQRSCPYCRRKSNLSQATTNPIFLVKDLVEGWLKANQNVLKLLKMVKNPNYEEELRVELTASLTREYEQIYAQKLEEKQNEMDVRHNQEMESLYEIQKQDLAARIQIVIDEKDRQMQSQLEIVRRDLEASFQSRIDLVVETKNREVREINARREELVEWAKKNKKECQEAKEELRAAHTAHAMANKNWDARLRIAVVQAESVIQQKADLEKAVLVKRINDLTEGKESVLAEVKAVASVIEDNGSRLAELIANRAKEIAALKASYDEMLAQQKAMVTSELENLRRAVTIDQDRKDSNSEELSRLRTELAQAKNTIARSGVAAILAEPGAAERELIRLGDRVRELESEVSAKNKAINDLKVEFFDATRLSRQQPVIQHIYHEAPKNKNADRSSWKNEGVVGRSKEQIFLGKNY